MWINGRWVPMGLGFYFDADKGGSGGGGDEKADDKSNDKSDDIPNDDKDGVSIEELKKELEKEHKKELDRYRNDIGQLKKQLKEIQEKGMSEEEKLVAKQKELEEKEKELKVKELTAHKAEQIAEQELDKRLADYIKVNANKTEEDIDEDVKTLKSAVDAIVQERIEKLQESGSVLNGFNFNTNKKNNKTSIGEELAKFNKENNKGVEDAQKNYFGSE